MVRFFFVSIVSGFLFGTFDMVINANPYARKLFKVYEPIAKASVNAPAGIVIDIVYGLVMAFIFITLYEAIPGDTGLIKGLVFGVIAWFFRVLMNTVTTWMMFKVSLSTLLYMMFAGLFEMLAIGAVYGLFLRR